MSFVCFKFPLREEAVSRVTMPYIHKYIYILYLPKYIMYYNY